MDLTTILGAGLFSALAGFFGAYLTIKLVYTRLLDGIGAYIDAYVANFVNELANNAEFRKSIAQPFIADIMKEFGVNKAQGGSETLKIGGFRVPMALIEMFLGRAANKGTEAVASALPGLLG